MGRPKPVQWKKNLQLGDLCVAEEALELLLTNHVACLPDWKLSNEDFRLNEALDRGVESLKNATAMLIARRAGERRPSASSKQATLHQLKEIVDRLVLSLAPGDSEDKSFEIDDDTKSILKEVADGFSPGKSELLKMRAYLGFSLVHIEANFDAAVRSLKNLRTWISDAESKIDASSPGRPEIANKHEITEFGNAWLEFSAAFNGRDLPLQADHPTPKQLDAFIRAGVALVAVHEKCIAADRGQRFTPASTSSKRSSKADELPIARFAAVFSDGELRRTLPDNLYTHAWRVRWNRPTLSHLKVQYKKSASGFATSAHLAEFAAGRIRRMKKLPDYEIIDLEIVPARKVQTLPAHKISKADGK